MQALLETGAATIRSREHRGCQCVTTVLSQTLEIESHGVRLPRSAHLHSEGNLSSNLIRHPARFAMLSTERYWFLQMSAPEDTDGRTDSSALPQHSSEPQPHHTDHPVAMRCRQGCHPSIQLMAWKSLRATCSHATPQPTLSLAGNGDEKDQFVTPYD